MSQKRHAWIYVGIICALHAVAGCNQTRWNTAAIAGDVTLDGKPLERGTIRFLPGEGVEGTAVSGEIVDGCYRLSRETGPAVGPNRVEINGLRKTGRIIQKPFPRTGTTEEVVEAVPPQFNSASILMFDLKQGENVADFALTSK